MNNDDRKQREIGIRLAKLLEGGAQLNSQSIELAQTYSPQLDAPEQDEFQTWFYGVRTVIPPTADEATDLSAKAISKIIQEKGDWEGGHFLRALLREDPDKALDVMDCLAEMGESRANIWVLPLQSDHFALKQDEEEAEKEKILKCAQQIGPRLLLLLKTHPAMLAYMEYGLAWFLERLSSWISVEVESMVRFWDLWNLIWTHISESEGDAEVAANSDNVTKSLNSTAGKLGEIILTRLWKRDLEDGSGIPSEFLTRFKLIFSQEKTNNLLAHIIFSSQLVWLHNLDPQWTDKNVISRMHWPLNSPSSPSIIALWQGFLWRPFRNPSLLLALRDYLLLAVQNSSQLLHSHHNVEYASNLYSIFADALVESPQLFNSKTLPTIFNQLDTSALADIARLFKDKLEHAGDKAANLWNVSIKPIFENYWPYTTDKTDSKTVFSLSWMLLQTRESFPDALALLTSKGLIAPTQNLIMVFSLLSPKDKNDRRSVYDYALNHPTEVLKLLNLIIEPNRVQFTKLKEVLTVIGETKPILKESRAFLKLTELT